MYKRSLGEHIFNILNIAFLGGIGLLALYPFVYTLTISLSNAAAANADGLHLWPRQFSLMAYKMVLSNRDILTGYGNTLYRTVAGTVCTLIATCIAAYPLARKQMPHRRSISFIILFTMIFSGGMVPGYLLIKNLHLIDNRLVYIIPGLLSAFNVIIIANFFKSIPESLAESATIDGASEWSILWRIYIPLSKPVLATVALWTAVAHWNMWFDAMLYISSDSKQVLQTFLQRIVIESSTEMVEKGIVNPQITQFTPETIKAATVVVTILPILLFYPFVQKYFVKGIMLGGVKE